MSASRMPTLSPRSRKPSARLTAVVDLPTPPLPEATAMIAATPGMPDCDGAEGAPGAGPGLAGPDLALWACPACGAACGRCGAPPAPDDRSAVSATITDLTPGTARIAASARSRTASQALTAPASTVIDKNTLPSLATTSESFPLAGRAEPSGPEILPRAARTSSLRSVMTPYIGRLR